jgi:subtilisin family serine protease
MKRIASIVLALVLAAPLLAAADEDRRGPNPERGRTLHYLVSSDRVLDTRELAADGIEVQHVLPGNRYLVRTDDAATLAAIDGVKSVERYGLREKLSREGLRAAASTNPFVTVSVVFHDDTTFQAAQAAVDAAGGTIETPLDIAMSHPQRLQVRLAPASIGALARDEAVFGVYGRPLRPRALNDTAANLSHVTPLYSAPYGLDGTGIVLSQWEPDDGSGSGVDTSHPELTGRVTTHNTTKVGAHATHVAGTMIAKGVVPKAKGMAPNATLHEYNLSGDAGTIFSGKAGLGPLGITADNNSWGFLLGWQPDGTGSIPWVWEGAQEYIGAYDALYSAPYDKLAIDPAVGVLFVHSSGNDGANGTPDLDANGRHFHTDINGDKVTSEIWCYSKNGSGTDCPTPTCSAGNSTKGTDDNGNTHVPMCETVKHATYGPYNTMSFIASEKNVLAVGAIDIAGFAATFSSRGPTRDGRLKPELVAQGVDQYSSIPNNLYASMSGTSMSSPVVTGISALVAQQWKQTFNARPTPQQLKTLLIAGARDQVGPSDVDLPGPDFTYGFGLVDAQNSVDLIRADGATGSHIRTATVANGASVEVPLTVTSSGKFRAVLGWADPEAVLPPPSDSEDPVATRALVNDLDLKIIDPSGNTVLPYVLDAAHPNAAATRGVNTVDNTEVVEIANAAPGNYRAVITGRSVPVNSPQTFVFVSTLAAAGNAAPPCTDAFEPNDTPATAGLLVAGQAVSAMACANDTDWFEFTTNRSGPVSITVTAKDTPLTVVLNSPGPTPQSTVTVPANSTATLNGAIGNGTNQILVPPQTWLVKVTPAGGVTGDSSYTLTANFPASNLGRAPGRRPH